MTVVGGGTSSTGLVARVKNILLTPKTEWDVIDAEPATVKGLYTGYILILALIPAIAILLLTFVASAFMGMASNSVFGASVGISPVFAIVSAAVSYVLSLIMIYVMALIIDGLAPTFGAAKNRVQALKVATYSATAGWVAAIALIAPLIGVLVALAGAVYTAYLLYLGLQAVMKAPQEKAVGYTIVVIIVSLVAAFIINAVLNLPLKLMQANSVLASSSAINVKIPGVGTVDIGKMEQAAKEMEAAAQQMQAASGTVAAGGTPAGVVAPDVLQGLLPAALPNGFARTEVSSMGANMGGLGGTHAEGVYTKGDARISLEVTDIGAAGAMMGAVRVNSNKQTADGYEKIGQVDGRMTTEEYNRSSNSGKYGVLVASRYMVEADGSRVTIEDLKAAVSAVPLSRLEALAKG